MSKDTKRPRRLDPDTIVEGALTIADAEGLSAVTIRRLAQYHDVTPMALYRHFADKDELFDALAQRLLADVFLPLPNDDPWYEQMRDALGALVGALRPHPNVAGLAATRILASEPGLVLTERTLELLAEGGFTPVQAAEMASQALSSLVALVTPEPAANEDPDPEARDDAIRAKRAALAALSPRRFPHLVAAADTLACCSSGQSDFNQAVDLIVAGMRGIQPAG